MPRRTRTGSSRLPLERRPVSVERIVSAGRREPVEEKLVADRECEHANSGEQEEPPLHRGRARFEEDSQCQRQHHDSGENRKTGKGAERAGDIMVQMPSAVEFSLIDIFQSLEFEITARVGFCGLSSCCFVR